MDGVLEKLGSYMLEPPGLFRGRGEHPKSGTLKGRLKPEDVTLNMGRMNAPPIAPQPGHAWGSIVHNNNATWLAMYKNIEHDSAREKYLHLNASSRFKGASDLHKFEKARNLGKIIDQVRASYTQKMSSGNPRDYQIGTAIYLIDKLALRVGNEKGEDEADTVGCCSLRVEHVVFNGYNSITLDFLGKDSIRY